MIAPPTPKTCPRCGFNFGFLDAATREKLDRRLDTLELAVRTLHALHGITYVGELIQKTESELLKITNFGRKSLLEIREVAKEFGFLLGYGIDGWTPPISSSASAASKENRSQETSQPTQRREVTNRLKSRSVNELKALRAAKEAAVRKAIGFFPDVVRGEVELINRELERREPKTVFYTVDVDDLHHGSGTWFYFPGTSGGRRRVHPRKGSGGTRYPQDLCADEIDAWMRREGITHVFSETDDTETTDECIKRGKHTRAVFIKWWRQLEDEDGDC